MNLIEQLTWRFCVCRERSFSQKCDASVSVQQRNYKLSRVLPNSPKLNVIRPTLYEICIGIVNSGYTHNHQQRAEYCYRSGMMLPQHEAYGMFPAPLLFPAARMFCSEK